MRQPPPHHVGVRLVERREAQRSGGRPRKPSRIRTRAPRETDSQSVLVRHADEPLAKARHEGSRTPLAPPGAPFLLEEEMQTGPGRPRPQVKRMSLRAFAGRPPCRQVRKSQALFSLSRHCERSEAIHSFEGNMDCFVASLLAMTRAHDLSSR